MYLSWDKSHVTCHKSKRMRIFGSTRARLVSMHVDTNYQLYNLGGAACRQTFSASIAFTGHREKNFLRSCFSCVRMCKLSNSGYWAIWAIWDVNLQYLWLQPKWKLLQWPCQGGFWATKFWGMHLRNSAYCQCSGTATNIN